MQRNTEISYIKNPLLLWFERRLPLIKPVRHFLYEHPTPKNLNSWWNFGVLALFCLAVMIVSGLSLAMHYIPTADLAFESIQRIKRDVNFGWLVQGIHSNFVFFFFAVVYIHMFRGIYYGSHKAPRELVWITGMLIYLTLMATAFFGYVLVWGQMSFHGAAVITNLLGVVPFVGESLLNFVRGDIAIDSATLNRFFVFHFLLPFVLIALIFLHIWALHKYGSNNPLGIDMKSAKDSIPFHPYYTSEKLFFLGVFLIISAIFVFYFPELQIEPENSVVANPFETPGHIVPEWYLLTFYAILRSIPSKELGAFAMVLAILVLFLLPWLDRSRTRSFSFRPVQKWLFWVMVFTWYMLATVGRQSPGDDYSNYLFSILYSVWEQLTGLEFQAGEQLAKLKIGMAPVWNLLTFGTMPWKADDPWKVIEVGQLFTFWYFFHFLILLPFTSSLERERKLPESISEAMAAKHRAAA